MILDIYKDSFEFSAKKITTLLVMGVLSFFGFLIIPLIIVTGYNYNVIKSSIEGMINGGDVPPEIEGFKSLFINGLKYCVVIFCYNLIPFILLAVNFQYPHIGLILLSLILIFIGGIGIFIAIPHMASNGDSLKSAFSFKELISIIKSIGVLNFIGSYIGILIINFAIILVVSLILIAIFLILGLTTYVFSTGGLLAISAFGNLVLFFVITFIISPYMSLFYDRCCGLIYNMR